MEKPKLKKIEFEKWRAICDSMGGVSGVLASIANMSYMVDILAWVPCQRGRCRRCDSVGKVAGVLALVAY